MNGRVTLLLPVLLLATTALLACEEKKKGADGLSAPGRPAEITAAPGVASMDTERDIDIDPTLLAAFSPLPSSFGAASAGPTAEERVVLGRMLYFEKRLSRDKDFACQSCHVLANHGVDGEPTSDGHRGQRGKRNSPTVYNAAGHFVQFWDGRARNVEEQAKGPILNPIEMAMPSEDAVVVELGKVAEYRVRFKRAFPEDKKPLSFDNVARAIGAFERTLVTPSRWDKFLAGDKTALSRDEKAGFKKFESTGCTSCHSGMLVGGHTFQKLGLVKPWPSNADLGRYEITRDEADKMVFKVPSLRNVAKTGPYFHDGSVATLEEAVRRMAIHQLGKTLTNDDVAAISTWLNALTGELPPAEHIAPPPLPR